MSGVPIGRYLAMWPMSSDRRSDHDGKGTTFLGRLDGGAASPESVDRLVVVVVAVFVMVAEKAKMKQFAAAAAAAIVTIWTRRLYTSSYHRK